MISLEDPAATAEVVGAKAAELARARRLGLPVLPGVALAAEHSLAALRLGVAALTSGGSGAARLAIMNFDLDENLRRELTAAAGGLAESLVVRSSSPYEADGTWAGAFVSYVGVNREELGVAVRGCWASVFSPDALGRCEAQGIDPAMLRMAVLVQPEIGCEFAGTARVHADATVSISATRGSPVGLMSGWRSSLNAVVRADHRLDAGTAATVPAGYLLEVAGLARRVKQELGDDVIEWGRAADGLFLLQCRRSKVAVQSAEQGALAALAGFASPLAMRAARLVARFPGPLGEELILPWAITTDHLPHAHELSAAKIDPPTAAAEVRALAQTLVGAVWPVAPERAQEIARQALVGLRDGQLAELPIEPKPLRSSLIGLSRRLIALLRGIGLHLAGAGIIGRDDEMWRFTLAELNLLMRNHGPGPVANALSTWGSRWERFLEAVVVAGGEHFWGVGASPGTGAGVARFLASPAGPLPELPAAPRPVIIVRQPLAAFAPLLWNAAGLIALTGSPGAHLMEVAESLRVPAVVGCPIDHLITSSATQHLLAVDGSTGLVAALAP